MPEGLVRPGDFKNGTPITLPHDFGNDVTLPMNFGNPVPPTDATFNSNQVTWLPSPAHFGNVITPSALPGDFLVQEDGSSLFEFEDGTGFILLEN